MTHLSLSDLRKDCIQKRLFLQNDTQSYSVILENLSLYLLKGLKELEVITNNPIKNLGFYWPIRGEPDIKKILCQWQTANISRKLALPVTTINEPLIFRQWDENTIMRPGLANIPEPQNTPEITVDVIIAPCVAWRVENDQIWRLGYGGGYYDRTLFSYFPTQQRPLLIGVSFDELQLDSRLWSIHPQDFPLDGLITQSSFTVGPSLKSF